MPKKWTVIHVAKMAQFMHDYVVNNWQSVVHQAPIQADDAFGCRATPASPCIAES